MSTDATLTGLSGREASMARRKALSQGKAALPPATERLRSGFRQGAMPRDVQIVASGPTTAAAPAALPDPRPDADLATGRVASMARRKALSQGKSALPPATERVRSGFRQGMMPQDVSAPAAQTPENTVDSGATVAPSENVTFRKGAVEYPVKVSVAIAAGSGTPVTGLSDATGRAMTGAEAGRDKPLTGTQCVTDAEGGYRPGPGKIGRVLTAGGQTVSGTMVRSSVQITGDEDRTSHAITGNADQSALDMLDQRTDTQLPVATQFPQRAQPNGHTVHGTRLGRSARPVGQHAPRGQHSIEQTTGGLPVSGTAIGRSVRVTGDEPGAQRSLTGSQYLAPAAAQAVDMPRSGRADPASGGKVSNSQTRNGQTVTGPQMEHDTRVTGAEHGSCATMTGTPYFGASGAYGWCDPQQAGAEEARHAPRSPRAITGDVPLNDPMVSGTGRGAEREITGSSYFVAGEADISNPASDEVSTSIEGFSVRSPQRAAHLKNRTEPADAASAHITGTFAQGNGKITGNVEFNATPRSGRSGPAHRMVTGEGSVRGTTITGSAWSDDGRVTGTEDKTASSRNPTQHGGAQHGFAGVARFRSKAVEHQQTSSVTGAVGWTSTSGAAVTLSGGAAG